MSQVIVMGHSDDIVSVEGDITQEFSPPRNSETDRPECFLIFSDGTILNVKYAEGGIWRIVLIVSGRAMYNLEQSTMISKHADVATLVDYTTPFLWVAMATDIMYGKRSLSAIR